MRGGVDARLARNPETGRPGHTMIPVYSEMLFQISRDYAGLPDPRTLRLSEIRWFYAGLRAELREHTKPRKGK